MNDDKKISQIDQLRADLSKSVKDGTFKKNARLRQQIAALKKAGK